MKPLQTLNRAAFAGALFSSVAFVSIAAADPALDSAREQAQVKKTLVVADEIGLDEKQERLFWPLYNNYQSDLQRLGSKRIALIKQATSAGKSMTDAQASEIIRKALALEEERLAAKRRNVGLFLDKLPPRIVARYFQLENQIQADIDAQLAERMPLLGKK